MLHSIKSSLRDMVPERARSEVSLHVARKSFHQFMVRALGGFYAEVSEEPIPPPTVTMKTSALDERSFKSRNADHRINRNAYLRSGYNDAHAFLRQAARHGLNLRTLRAVFDFGCGDGRIIRHLRAIDGIRLVGSDTRPEAVEWCQKNLPGPEYHVNDFTPPLQFLPDNSVDLAYAFSVFTHIPLNAQSTWAAEMQRVVRQGGFFLVTVMGQSHKQWLPQQRREELERSGDLEITSDDTDAHLATRIGGSRWDVYRRRDRIVELFDQFFEVNDYLCNGLSGEEFVSGSHPPAGQDLLVLRRRSS